MKILNISVECLVETIKNLEEKIQAVNFHCVLASRLHQGVCCGCSDIPLCVHMYASAQFFNTFLSHAQVNESKLVLKLCDFGSASHVSENGEMISWRTTIGGREHTDESHWPHGGATVQAKTTRPLSCKKLLLLFSKSSLIFASFIQSPLQKDFSCTSASCFSLQICRLIS